MRKKTTSIFEPGIYSHIVIVENTIWSLNSFFQVNRDFSITYLEKNNFPYLNLAFSYSHIMIVENMIWSPNSFFQVNSLLSDFLIYQL